MNLSDKIQDGNQYMSWFHKDDVKEAVKELKASLFREAIEREKHISDPSLDRLPLSSIGDKIDKIFGEALI